MDQVMNGMIIYFNKITVHLKLKTIMEQVILFIVAIKNINTDEKNKAF